MNGTPPTTTQNVKNSTWKKTENDGYSLECIKGELIHSTIWIVEQNHSEKNRYCSIILKGNDQLIYPHVYRAFHEAGSKKKYLTGPAGVSRLDHIFHIHVSDNQSQKFLEFINLIDRISPLGKEAITLISKLVTGYAIEGNAALNFLPMFGFLIAMNTDKFFPREITNFICQLFIQSTRIEFAKNNSNEFYKEFTSKHCKDF